MVNFPNALIPSNNKSFGPTQKNKNSHPFPQEKQDETTKKVDRVLRKRKRESDPKSNVQDPDSSWIRDQEIPTSLRTHHFQYISESNLIRSGLPNGIGQFVFCYQNTLMKFNGNISEGRFNGKGQLIIQGIASYESRFKDGFAEGEGTLKAQFLDKQIEFKHELKFPCIRTNQLITENAIPLGEINNAEIAYRGEIKEGKAEGFGMIVFPTQFSFFGVFDRGDTKGTGLLQYEINRELIRLGTCDLGFKFSPNQIPPTETSLIFSYNCREVGSKISYYKVFGPNHFYFGDMDRLEVAHGKGVYNLNQTRYEGLFDNGLPHGEGRFTFNNQESLITYIGKVEKGFPHGLGMVAIPGIATYSDVFFEGCSLGEGTLKVQFLGKELQFAHTIEFPCICAYFPVVSGLIPLDKINNADANYSGEINNRKADGSGEIVFPTLIVHTGHFFEGESIENGYLQFQFNERLYFLGPSPLQFNLCITKNLIVNTIYPNAKSEPNVIGILKPEELPHSNLKIRQSKNWVRSPFNM